MLELNEIKISFIKIDVEGQELDVYNLEKINIE